MSINFCPLIEKSIDTPPIHTCAARFRLTKTTLKFIELYFYTDLNIRECQIENYFCFLLSLFDDIVSTDIYTYRMTNCTMSTKRELGRIMLTEFPGSIKTKASFG